MSTGTSTRTGLGTSAGLGALVYVAGYLVTYVWQSANVENAHDGYNFVADLFGGDPIPAWKGVGWLYYNAHGVVFTHPELGGGRGARNFIANGNAPELLYLLPPLFLLAAGVVVARAASARSADAGARAGVGVVVGYFLLALVGLAVFQHTSGGSTIHVDYVPGVLLAGVVYPVVFGGLGGALGGATTT